MGSEIPARLSRAVRALPGAGLDRPGESACVEMTQAVMSTPSPWPKMAEGSDHARGERHDELAPMRCCRRALVARGDPGRDTIRPARGPAAELCLDHEPEPNGALWLGRERPAQFPRSRGDAAGRGSLDRAATPSFGRSRRATGRIIAGTNGSARGKRGQGLASGSALRTRPAAIANWRGGMIGGKTSSRQSRARSHPVPRAQFSAQTSRISFRLTP